MKIILGLHSIILLVILLWLTELTELAHLSTQTATGTVQAIDNIVKILELQNKEKEFRQ
jgi:hypothetical protein